MRNYGKAGRLRRRSTDPNAHLQTEAEAIADELRDNTAPGLMFNYRNPDPPTPPRGRSRDSWEPRKVWQPKGG